MPRTLANRFWPKVDTHGPIPTHKPELGRCHQWVASIDSRGYGQIKREGGREAGLERAHRVAFMLAHGRFPMPEGLHLCDNRRCVKAVADATGPAHVVEGTQTENMADASAKGRMCSGARRAAINRARGLRGERHPGARLTAKAVALIRASSESGAALARRLGVHEQTVRDVRLGRSWTEK